MSNDREAFEAWWIPLNYKQVSENIAWLAWQAALASERAKQAEPAAFPGGPRMGSALQKLGARLADMLDDDQWNNIEPMLLDVHAEAAPPAAQAVMDALAKIDAKEGT